MRALRRPAEAAAHYQRVIELQPDSAEAWLNLGLLLTGFPGEREAAAAALRRALALRPDLSMARQALENLN